MTLMWLNNKGAESCVYGLAEDLRKLNIVIFSTRKRETGWPSRIIRRPMERHSRLPRCTGHMGYIDILCDGLSCSLDIRIGTHERVNG